MPVPADDVCKALRVSPAEKRQSARRVKDGEPVVPGERVAEGYPFQLQRTGKGNLFFAQPFRVPAHGSEIGAGVRRVPVQGGQDVALVVAVQAANAVLL